MHVYYSTEFTSESITWRMGKEGAVREIAAGTTGIARDGEDEENGIWTDAEKKRAAAARYIKSKKHENKTFND